MPASAFEELAKLPENNPGPVFQIDQSGIVLLANGASRQLFNNEHLIGQRWTEICPEFTDETWQSVLDAGVPIQFERSIGDSIFIFTFVRPQQGNFVYAYGNDVTAFRHAQLQIAEQAAILREQARFPEMNPGPVFRLDLSGFVLLANSAARDIFGDGIVGKCWMDLFPNMNTELWNRVLVAVEPCRLEARIGAKNFVFAHRRDYLSNLVFVYGSDITEQKKAEVALVQSGRMATLGTLAAGIAHELNNPAAATRRAAEQLQTAFAGFERAHMLLDGSMLTSEMKEELERLGNIARERSVQMNDVDPLARSDQEVAVEDWLEDNGIDDPWDLAPSLVGLSYAPDQLDEIKDAFGQEHLYGVLMWLTSIFQVHSLLSEISFGSGRISEIVGALKNYSFLGQAPVQSVSVHESIDNTLVILRNKMKKGVGIVRDYGTDVPMITAYGSELNQVWTNLLDNATDAMGGMGEIVIRTRFENNRVIVEIEDNGPGIPAEIQSRIFDPFFTTKEPGKGTGLGLATTYGIITEKHNGTISVESRPGLTRFTVTLPIDQPRVNGGGQSDL